MPPIDDNGTLVGFNLANPSFQSTIAPGAPKGMWFVGDSGLSNTVSTTTSRISRRARALPTTCSAMARPWFAAHTACSTGSRRACSIKGRTPCSPWISISTITTRRSGTISFRYPGGDPFPRGHVGPSQFKNYTFLYPLAGGVLNPASKVEYTQAYNFAIEQDLGNGFAVNLGYVGNRAEHVMASRQFNPFVLTTPTFETTRTYHGPRRGGIGRLLRLGEDQRGGVKCDPRSAHGLTLLSNIVWMKTIDVGSSGTEGQAGPSNPFNLNFYKGVADFDQALRFTASANYPFPKFHVNNIAAQIVNGWQANAIVTSQSGLPITITSGVDNSETGIGNDLGVYNPGVSIKPPAGSPKTEWFNPLAFGKNPVPSAANNYTQSFGNVPRNSLRGPAYEDTDISLFKDILSEHRVHGQFQAEAFNAWNHTNFANPAGAVSSGTFGKSPRPAAARAP